MKQTSHGNDMNLFAGVYSSLGVHQEPDLQREVPAGAASGGGHPSCCPPTHPLQA